MVDCLNHGLNGLRRFHGLNDVFDGRDSEKISIALTVRSVMVAIRISIDRPFSYRGVCEVEIRRMAAGFGNPAGAVLGGGGEAEWRKAGDFYRAPYSVA